MLNKNGKIHMVKNIWQRCKQIWTHCFFVASYYIVSYYRFLNTDPVALKYVGWSAALQVFTGPALHVTHDRRIESWNAFHELGSAASSVLRFFGAIELKDFFGMPGCRVTRGVFKISPKV
jgi:hypothetical protein